MSALHDLPFPWSLSPLLGVGYLALGKYVRYLREERRRREGKGSMSNWMRARVAGQISTNADLPTDTYTTLHCTAVHYSSWFHRCHLRLFPLGVRILSHRLCPLVSPCPTVP